jgi:hypothetical protein
MACVIQSRSRFSGHGSESVVENLPDARARGGQIQPIMPFERKMP